MSGEYEAMRDCIREGLVEVIEGSGNGSLDFRITGAGEARVEAILDSAIEGYGHRAPEALSRILGIPYEMAEELIEHRRGARE